MLIHYTSCWSQSEGERLQETGGQVGLKINTQKTMEMRIGVSQQQSLVFHGKAVERVSEFAYLGSIISETGGTDEGITARTRKAQLTFSKLIPVWKEKCIRLQAQDFQYKHQVFPSVWFGNMQIDETTFINKCLK